MLITGREISNSSALFVIFYGLLSVLAAFAVSTNISNRELDPDAVQNVRTASHLLHYGIYSYDHKEPPVRPTMKREPLPIFVLAGWIMLDYRLSHLRPYERLYSGFALTALKQVNLAWAFLTYIGICYLVWITSTNLSWRVIVPPFIIFMTNYSFFDSYVDRLLTEPPAACFLVWAACMLLKLVQSPGRNNAIRLAVFLALLSLTKAAFFYVSLCLIIVLGLFLYYRHYRRHDLNFTVRRAVAVSAVVLVSFLLVISIWIVRNGIALGQYRIADRGGDIFYFRVLLMQKPILGSLYAFSPRPYKPLIGELTGYNQEDLKSGGILEYAKKMRWDIYREMMRAEGVKYTRSKAQGWLMRKGLEAYITHPSYYLVWPLVFAYRVSFFLTPARNIGPFAFIASLLLVCNFLLVTIISIVTRRLETAAVFILPLTYYAFVAVVTHGIPRYGEPLTPFVWLAAAYTASALLEWLGQTWKSLVGQDDASVRRATRMHSPHSPGSGVEARTVVLLNILKGYCRPLPQVALWMITGEGTDRQR